MKVVSILMALYINGADRPPDEQPSFADPAKCAAAAVFFNDTLPKLIEVRKDSKQGSRDLDKISRFVCVDGVVSKD